MQDTRWLHYAILAAACAASINIFGKIGMRDIDPDFSTAIRSVVQALFVVGLAIALGAWSRRETLHGRPLAMAMIVCSGVAGGLSWVFAFRALKLADVSQVAPIDKLSMPLGIILAVIILGERPTLINWIGILLIAGGAYLATWPRPKPPAPSIHAGNLPLPGVLPAATLISGPNVNPIDTDTIPPAEHST